MRKTNKIIILIILAGLLPRLAAYGQGGRESRGLIYTFIGPVGGGSMHHITYNDWFHYYRGSKKIDGTGFSGGMIFSIYSKNFTGDFTMQFKYNYNEKVLYHMEFAIAGKYVGRVHDIFFINPGLGLYFESPPSNRQYRGGAGFHIPLAFVFNTSFDTKLFIEGFFRYGWYEMGEESTKMSYGGTLGFMVKVGRI